MTWRLLLALIAILVPSPSARAQDRASGASWMAHCAENLKSSGMSRAGVRKYCACMTGLGDEDDMLAMSQTELERSYPPAHERCAIVARGGRDRPSR